MPHFGTGEKNQTKKPIKSTLILPVAKEGIRSDLKSKETFKKHISQTLSDCLFKIISENI